MRMPRWVVTFNVRSANAGPIPQRRANTSFVMSRLRSFDLTAETWMVESLSIDGSGGSTNRLRSSFHCVVVDVLTDSIIRSANVCSSSRSAVAENLFWVLKSDSG